jgi:hypothetical protein
MDDWSTWLTLVVWVPSILYAVWFRRHLLDLDPGIPKLRPLRWCLTFMIVVGCLLVAVSIVDLLYF